MAKAIIQLCPHSPMAPLPDFQNLSPEQKEGIYHHIEEELEPGSGNCALTRRHDIREVENPCMSKRQCMESM
jgi:hypothetical protein